MFKPFLISVRKGFVFLIHLLKRGNQEESTVKVILILIPKTSLFGAVMGCGIMVGAIFAHLLVLGIEVKNDSGILFILALITFLCCVTLVLRERTRLMNLLN